LGLLVSAADDDDDDDGQISLSWRDVQGQGHVTVYTKDICVCESIKFYLQK